MKTDATRTVPPELAHAPAAKVARILRDARDLADDDVLPILVAWGSDFAEQLVRALATNGTRFGPADPTYRSGLTLRLLAALDAAPVDHAPYLEDWALHAASLLRDDVPASARWRATPGLTLAHVLRHVPDHVRLAAEHGIPTPSSIETLVPELVARGELERETTVEVALMALDTARRPVDRAHWLTILREHLAFSDDEVRAAADRLVPLLAHTETRLVEELAPALLASDDDATVGDVLLTALHVRSAKARRTVLAAALARRAPADPEVLELAAVAVAPLLGSKDRGVVKAAAALVEAWGLDVPDDDAPEAQAVAGRWNPTPPPWTLPRFVPAEATVRSLERLVAVVARRPERTVDVLWEQLLTTMNTVAASDREGARSALAGVPRAPGDSFGMFAACVTTWLAGSEPTYYEIDRPEKDGRHAYTLSPVRARDAQVVHRLGTLPCLLSTPSREDLALDVADLADRLSAYAIGGVAASEGDLQLALARLDLSSVDASSRARLAALGTVPLVGGSGTLLGLDAVALTSAYLDDPYVLRDASRDTRRSRTLSAENVTIPASLAALPPRAHVGWPAPDPAAFPGWTQIPLDDVVPEGTPGTGTALLQATRRHGPLPSVFATALLVAPSTLLPVAVPEGSQAVRDAWSRGLLPPGAADASLPWARMTPTGVAALAASLLAAADDGAAAAVWPFLDDLLARFAALPRVPVGTAELVETVVALVPDALDAVARGIAAPAVLDVPGLRSLAARTGSAQAVAGARAAVNLLPVPAPDTSSAAAGSAAESSARSSARSTASPRRAATSRAAAPALPQAATLLDSTAFAEQWPMGPGAARVVDDGAMLAATFVAARSQQKQCALDLTVAHLGTFRVSTGWFYSLEVEGQVNAVPWTDGAPPQGSEGHARVWLFWDDAAQQLAVSPFRNRVDATSGPLAREARTPLTISMVAVMLAMACSDGSAYSPASALRDSRVGADAVRTALLRLLPLEDIDPGRVLRLLATDPGLLPVLWPLLVEPVRLAASLPKPPRWLPRVLDAATLHAPALRTAAHRGLLPDDAAEWPGLLDLAGRSGSSVAFRKAAALAALLGLVAADGDA
ncbi:hypothetical protein [Sanguibacter massiliensis]|uniref:hypothetical protein n=1 Tax=Sanguibacter massiliensis TaxID=1973217 RepID=UPI000C856C6A|nr:hypothetical protein [Sanguibacter massiliensis]